ncbi:MAG: hypothetical protein V2B19_06160 [Pseudomonadota bacterium]
MMLSELLQKNSLFRTLHKIDLDLSQSAQEKGCPFCGGVLHQANYPRKPRGGPAIIPEAYRIRQSLCCGREGCRRRSLPSSCLFMGRRVYWGAIILVVMCLRQGRLSGKSICSLERLFDISRQTIKRWILYFRDEFPQSPQWKALRGRVVCLVTNTGLPGALLLHFLNHCPSPEQAIVSCLSFFASGLVSGYS